MPRAHVCGLLFLDRSADRGELERTPPFATVQPRKQRPQSRRFSLTRLLSLIDTDQARHTNPRRSVKLDRPRAICVRTAAAGSGHAGGVYGACSLISASPSSPASARTRIARTADGGWFVVEARLKQGARRYGIELPRRGACARVAGLLALAARWIGANSNVYPRCRGCGQDNRARKSPILAHPPPPFPY